MATVKFVDTTLRDGHQCLWATRMSTAMMRPIMERMDRIGFEAIEVMGAVHFDACVRYLKDDPWERIRLLRRHVRGPLQVITRSRCALGFELQPIDIHRLFMVTPFSQLVGVQATLNVLEGERYARIPDEVKRFALGYYGTLPAPVEPGVLDCIVENGSPTIALTPPEPEPALDGLRKRYPHASDDERLLRHSFPPHVLDARTPEPPRRPAGPFDGIGRLVEAFGACKRVGAVSIQRGRFRLDLHR